MQHAHAHLAWEVIYNRNNSSCLWHRQEWTPGFSWTSLRHHHDVIKWKHFSLTGLCAGNSPVTGDAVAPIMTSLLCYWISARNLTGLSMINQYKPDSRPYDERSFNTFDVNTKSGSHWITTHGFVIEVISNLNGINCFYLETNPGRYRNTLFIRLNLGS